LAFSALRGLPPPGFYINPSRRGPAVPGVVVGVWRLPSASEGEHP